MLFVLRLLPAFNQWQEKVIYGTMIVNFAISLVATIIFGLSCMPLRAFWDNDAQMNLPGSKCYPVSRRVLVQQVNGSESLKFRIFRITALTVAKFFRASSTLS